MKEKLVLPLDNLLFFEEIDSTNEYLKSNYQKLNDLTFIRANFQTNGKGQFERVWESEKEQNLLFSMLLKERNFKDLETIKDLVIKTLINFLEKIKINAKFVYPNDIYVNNKKILGILIETKICKLDLEYVIIGIGININQTKFNTNSATSLKLINKKSYNIHTLYDLLVKEFIKTLKR